MELLTVDQAAEVVRQIQGENPDCHIFAHFASGQDSIIMGKTGDLASKIEMQGLVVFVFIHLIIHGRGCATTCADWIISEGDIEATKQALATQIRATIANLRAGANK